MGAASRLAAIAAALLVGACSSDPSTGGEAADAADGADGAAGGDGDGDGGGGGGADASLPAGDPGAPGEHAVHVDQASIPIGGDDAAATVCSPSADGGATPAAGPFPLVIVSPGFQLTRDQYQGACEHLASWGYLTITADYPGGGSIFDAPAHRDLAEGIGAIIDWATSGASGLAGRIDADRIAAAGHSLGGKVSVLAAILDGRIDVVIGWDPVDAVPPTGGSADSPSVTPEMMDDLDVPLAVIGETLDGSGGFMPCAPAADNFQQYYAHACASPHALQATAAGADHMDWVEDPGSCGFACSACQSGSADAGHIRLLTRRLTVAFLHTHLDGPGDLSAYLSLPALGDGVAVEQRLDGCN